VKAITRIGFLAALSVGILTGQLRPALADDQFARGCQLYNARNYTQALPIFNETVQKFPKFWPGHYYLGHTLLAMGQRSAAKKEYEAVLNCQPPPAADTLAACQKVLASLGGAAAPSASSASSSTPTASGDGGTTSTASAEDGDKKEEEKPETLREKERRWQIERLRKECEDKIAALKLEMKEKMTHSETNANQWYKYPDGTVKIALSNEEEAAIEKEYQEKIAKVREESERRIAGIH
jgi:TolA-binding protein